MANRYWVGGTGTWNTSSTTNWSTASGGASGASVPTAADSVFFDQAGTYTVTMTGALVCLDITVSAGTVTFATGTAPTLAISGSVTLLAGTVWNSTGPITFNATTTGKTITTNGTAFSSNITFNGVGGGWTLGSSLTTSGTIIITNGAFNTSAAGNYALNAAGILSNNTNTRSLLLNASTVTFSGTGFTLDLGTVTTGLTFNAGTSQINFTSATGSGISSASQTFYNVTFTSNADPGLQTINISGTTPTFNNLTFTGITPNTGLRTIRLATSITVTNAFTCSAGSGASSRLFINSNTLGTAVTITAGSVSITDVDFRDITAAGASAPWSGTRLGDCRGNANITFPAAKTVYWNLAGAQSWGATGWATTSGGSPAAANFPLPQDTAVFNNTGSVTGTITISTWWNIGTLDMSARTSAMTLASGTNPLSIYGSWSNGSGTTLTGTGVITFTGRGNTQQIFGNGISFTQPITVNNIGGTVQLTSALTLGSTLTFTLTNGTLDLNDKTLTTGLFSSSNSNTRTIAFGTGNITVNGTGTIWNTPTATGLTTSGTQVVNVSNNTATSSTVNSGGLSEANSISFNFTTGTYSLSFLTSIGYTARDVNFTGFAGTWAATSTATVIYGNLTLSTGMTLTASAFGVTFGATSGTKTITTNGKTLDFPLTFNGVGGTWQLQDALTMGSTRTLTHTNGTIDLNGKTLTVGTSYATAAGTKNLTLNAGTLVCPASTTTAFNNASPTNFSTTAGTGTGTISMTGATAKTFVGGGSTYNCTINQGGAGALTITGANTFSNITNTVQPATITFPASTTNTFTNFSLSGTAGNLVTINSTSAGTRAILSKASGTVSCDYLSIQDSNATGGASWYAGANSTNVSNNAGWIFTAPPGGNTSNFFTFLTN